MQTGDDGGLCSSSRPTSGHPQTEDSDRSPGTPLPRERDAAVPQASCLLEDHENVAPYFNPDQADSFVKCGELENILLSDMRQYIVKAAQSSQAKLGAVLSTVTSKAISAVVRKQEVKNQECDLHLQDLDRGDERMLRAQNHMRTQIDEMRKQLHIMETIAPQAFDVSDSINFTRTPNKSILVVNSKEMVAIDEVTSVIKNWLAAAGFSDEQWRVKGNSPGRRFHIQFQGSEAMAARHACHALRQLKQPDGSWKRFECPMVAGGCSPLFLGMDKSPQQIRREVQTKKLAEIIAAKLDTRVRANRYQGVVSVGDVPLVRIAVADVSEEPSTLEWNFRAVSDRDVPKDTIQADFDARFGTHEKIQWQSARSPQ